MQFLALLADDVAVAVLARCREGAASEAELREATGAAHATLTARLALMQAHGLVQRHAGASRGGRRPSLWELANEPLIERFAVEADRFVAKLLRRLADQADPE